MVTDAKFGGSGAVAYFVNSSGTAIGDTSSSGLNALMRVNNQTLSGNVTITGTQNASMAVTIANGVTLTVQSGGKVCSSMSTIVATNIQSDTIKHSGGTTAMTIIVGRSFSTC